MNIALKKDEHYTYSDYLTWDAGERYELIEGIPYLMAPGPSRTHQRVVREIGLQIMNYLNGKPCEVFLAPFDVRLNANDEDDTVVQPDILVVCDESKHDEQSVKGAPDMVIEVLSPSTDKYDSTVKLGLYMKAGVKECWLIDPVNRKVRITINKRNEKEEQVSYAWDEHIPVGIFPGFAINMQKADAALK